MPVTGEEYQDLYDTVREAIESVSGLEGKELPVQWKKFRPSKYDKTFNSDAKREYESPVPLVAFFLPTKAVDLFTNSPQSIVTADMLVLVAASEIERIGGVSEKDQAIIEGHVYNVGSANPVIYGGPLCTLFYMNKAPLLDQKKEVRDKYVKPPEAPTAKTAQLKSKVKSGVEPIVSHKREPEINPNVSQPVPVTPAAFPKEEYATPPKEDFTDVFENHS
jgi:hypothetical protein